LRGINVTRQTIQRISGAAPKDIKVWIDILGDEIRGVASKGDMSSIGGYLSRVIKRIRLLTLCAYADAGCVSGERVVNEHVYGVVCVPGNQIGCGALKGDESSIARH
jgi:hypothetical protein